MTLSVGFRIETGHGITADNQKFTSPRDRVECLSWINRNVDLCFFFTSTGIISILDKNEKGINRNSILIIPFRTRSGT